MSATRSSLTAGVIAVAIALTSGAAPAPPSVLPAFGSERCVASDDDGNDYAASGAWVLETIVRCREELGLSAAQIERLDAVTAEFERETLHRQKELAAVQGQLLRLVRTDPNDPAKPVDIAAAETKIREMGRLLTDLDVATLRVVEAGKAVLTVEQRARVAALLVRPPERQATRLTNST